jgi:hypothetical protein
MSTAHPVGDFMLRLFCFGLSFVVCLSCASEDEHTEPSQPMREIRAGGGAGGTIGGASIVPPPVTAGGRAGNDDASGGIPGVAGALDEPSAGGQQPDSGGTGGSAPLGGSGGSSQAGSGGNLPASTCQGGEQCVDYQLPCSAAACVNGHVPYCFCGGGEVPLVECHEGGETC